MQVSLQLAETRERVAHGRAHPDGPVERRGAGERLAGHRRRRPPTADDHGVGGDTCRSDAASATAPPSSSPQAGRSSLLALDQYYTYEGLLLGVPTREMNQEMMDRLIARYVHPAEYGVPLLLEPEQQPLDVPAHIHRLGTPARLPSVTCIASFNSGRPASDTDDIWSVLRVIWFQDEFAFPIADRALRADRRDRLGDARDGLGALTPRA